MIYENETQLIFVDGIEYRFELRHTELDFFRRNWITSHRIGFRKTQLNYVARNWISCDEIELCDTEFNFVRRNSISSHGIEFRDTEFNFVTRNYERHNTSTQFRRTHMVLSTTVSFSFDKMDF